jgi:hypothetical protein
MLPENMDFPLFFRGEQWNAKPRPMLSQGESRMKCEEKNKTGAACGAPAVGDSGRCVMHADPDAAKLLGARGGARRKRTENLKTLQPPLTAAQVTLFLGEVLIETRNGSLSVRQANALAIVAATALKGFETAKLCRRDLTGFSLDEEPLSSRTKA